MSHSSSPLSLWLRSIPALAQSHPANESCLVICLGIFLIRVFQAPVNMEYCKVQKIRLPTQFSNSSAGSELALYVCVNHRYTFSTDTNTNTSDTVSVLYLIPPDILSKAYKTPISQLFSYLQNPEVINTWKRFVEKRFGQWKDRLYEQDVMKDASYGETYNNFNTKHTTSDPLQSVKKNSAGVSTDSVG
jgi:hypothetical protein